MNIKEVKEVIEKVILSFSTTVVFRDEANEKESLFICQMINVPRIGDTVELPKVHGEVIGVHWEIGWDKDGNADKYAGVVLTDVERKTS